MTTLDAQTQDKITKMLLVLEELRNIDTPMLELICSMMDLLKDTLPVGLKLAGRGALRDLKLLLVFAQMAQKYETTDEEAKAVIDEAVKHGVVGV